MIIRDPVHGDLAFTPIERRVMDTPSLQRLRGVRQTGTAYLVYPGCVHTRFEHSLGTCGMARRVIASVRANGTVVSARNEQVVALAALVHDVSHLPFGHTFEDERKLFPRHDTRERMAAFLDREDLARALDDSELREPVVALLTGAPSSDVHPWMREVVASTVDADLLDYLRRDAYFAGLRQDYDDRVFSTFTVVDAQLAVDGAKMSTRTELLHLLRLRYFLTERVYFHHAKVISGAMIAKAVEKAVQSGLTERDLYDQTDDGLLRLLRGSDDPVVARLVERVAARDLLKRAYTLSAADIGRRSRDDLIARFHRSPSARQELEASLAREASLPPEDVIVHCPDISSIKEASVTIHTNGGLRRLNEPADNPPYDVKAVEDQHERLWRFYVFAPAEAREAVGRLAREALGFPSGLPS